MKNYAPQIIFLFVLGYGLVEAKVTHGKQIKVNFWFEVISVIFVVTLLGLGGFFDYILGIGG